MSHQMLLERVNRVAKMVPEKELKAFLEEKSTDDLLNYLWPFHRRVPVPMNVEVPAGEYVLNRELDLLAQSGVELDLTGGFGDERIAFSVEETGGCISRASIELASVNHSQLFGSDADNRVAKNPEDYGKRKRLWTCSLNSVYGLMRTENFGLEPGQSAIPVAPIEAVDHTSWYFHFERKPDGKLGLSLVQAYSAGSCKDSLFLFRRDG